MSSRITNRWVGIFLFVIMLIVAVFNSKPDNKVIVDEQPIEIPKEQQLEIIEYIPLVKDHQWIYSINDDINDQLLVNVEFLKNNVVQMRFDSDYKDVVKVYTYEEDGFYEVATIDDITYKVDYTTTRQYKKPILKLPLEEGNSWQLAPTEVVRIERIDEDYTSKLGDINVIQVSYALEDKQVTVHYGEKMGVLNIQVDNGLESNHITLEEVYTDSTMRELVDVYYGNIEENTLDKVIQEVKVMTNEEPKHFLTDLLKMTVNEPYMQTLSNETVINNIFVDAEETTVHVDLNEAYVAQGINYKQRRLAALSLVNTVGNYYKADYVKLTVEGKSNQDYEALYSDDKGIEVGIY